VGGYIRYVASLVVVLATAPAAGAAPVFTGNVCGLLTAKQVTAVPGLTATCKKTAPLPGPLPGSKQYQSNWAGVTPKSPTLQVTVVKFADPGTLQLAVHNLKQGMSGGTLKKVTGIGDAAYEASGIGLGPDINVAIGKYVAYMSLSSIGSPKPTPVQLEQIAKDVAAKL
jgi:hypothetical protein